MIALEGEGSSVTYEPTFNFREVEKCPALRETSRTMRLSLFKSGGIFRVSPKRKAALSRTLVLRELYTAPKEAELSGVISGGGAEKKNDYLPERNARRTVGDKKAFSPTVS